MNIVLEYKYITIPISVTISANILIFPITIYAFGKFPGIFIIANVISIISTYIAIKNYKLERK